jgi:hypothetical protein
MRGGLVSVKIVIRFVGHCTVGFDQPGKGARRPPKRLLCIPLSRWFKGKMRLRRLCVVLWPELLVPVNWRAECVSYVTAGARRLLIKLSFFESLDEGMISRVD